MMNIDNVIAQLQAIREQHGPIGVRLLVNSNSGQTDDVRDVAICETQVTGWDRQNKLWKQEPCQAFVLITT